MRGAFARELRKVPRRRRVYVDETGANVAMTRLFGRAPSGERVRDTVPHAGWKAVTLAAAMRADGPTAALAYEGATDATAFETFVARHLCPTLRKGDVVILDRLGAHMGPAVRAAIEQAGARVLYLPPYSDDLKCDRGHVVDAQAATALAQGSHGRRVNRRDGQRPPLRYRLRCPRVL